MVNNLTVAWAIPVDPIALGASIETYASVKTTMLAFDKFKEKTPTGSAVKRLPGEMLDIIKEHVRQLAFEEHREVWSKGFACFEGSCGPDGHLSRKEYDSLHASFMSERNHTIAEGSEESDYSEESFEDWLLKHQEKASLYSDKHRDNIDTLERKIRENSDATKDDTKFADARKVGVTLHVFDL